MSMGSRDIMWACSMLSSRLSLGRPIITSNIHGCLEAVDEGDADVALCDGYLSEYLIRQNQQYSNLEIQSVVNKDHDISMVYSSQMPEEFVGIVDKTITTI